MRVWRRPREQYIDAAVKEKVAFGGGSVMVWGAFSLHHRTPLYHIVGNLTGVRYRDEILAPFVVPTMQRIGPLAIFQDDNARPHRARVAVEFLQQAGINTMNFPAYSPDLNPIEHMWDELGRRVKENHPPARDRQDLLRLLQLEWRRLPQRYLRTLVNSMRRRCEECLGNRGGHTHY